MLDFERILNTGMNPKDSLLSLEIETCYRSAPSLYCEVFRMPDGSGMLYWRTSLQFDNRIIQLIQHFGETYNIPMDRRIEEIFSDPLFVKKYQRINPAQAVSIPAAKMHVVYKIIEEGLPKDVQYPHGLDGHEYYLTTYGIIKQEYQAWVHIPKEWSLFTELIAMLIEVAGWKQTYNCQFYHFGLCRGQNLEDGSNGKHW